MLDQIEYWHNKASDTPYVWFPFGRFKPEPFQLLDWKRKFLMSLSFGVYYGVYYSVSRRFSGNAVELKPALIVVGEAVVGFFIWFNTVTSFFWNRRAKRLAASSDQVSLLLVDRD